MGWDGVAVQQQAEQDGQFIEQRREQTGRCCMSSVLVNGLTEWMTVCVLPYLSVPELEEDWMKWSGVDGEKQMDG